MTLSNKKIKFIKRSHLDMSARDIAAHLKISLGEVEQEIQRLTATKVEKSLDLAYWVDKAAFVLMLAIVALAPFAIRDHLFDFTNLPHMIFVSLSALLICILVCARIAIFGHGLIFPWKLAAPMLGLLAWAALSMVWGPSWYEAMYSWIPWAAAGGFFIAVVNILDSKSRCIWLLKALFFSGFAVALLGIFQHLGGVDWVLQAVPPASTFSNRNMAVHYIVLTLPLGVMFFLRAKNGPWGIGFLVCTTLMLNYLFYTSNRAGWICLGFQVMVFTTLALAAHKRIKGAWTFKADKAFAVAACAVLFLVLFNMTSQGFEWQFGKVFERVKIVAEQVKESTSEPSPSQDTASPESNAFSPAKGEAKAADTSLELRLHIWANSVPMIKENFLVGVGLGNHKVVYPIYARRVVVEKVFSEDFQLSNVHNDYIQTMAELGVVGMAFIGLCVIMVVMTILRIWRQDDPEKLFLALAMVTALAGICLNACASFPFQRMIPVLVVAVYVAILFSLSRQEADDSSYHPPRPIAALTGVGFLVLMVFGGWTSYHVMEGDRYYRFLGATEAMGNWDRSIYESKKVIEHSPNRAKVYSYLGRAYIEKGMHKAAIPPLEKVTQVYPYHMNALLNLGVAYGVSGDYEKAMEAYARVLEIKPDYAKVHNNLGNTYVNSGNPEKALESFKRAIKYDPSNAVVHMNLGVAAFELKKYELAADAFVKAAQLNPGWIRAHKNAGMVLLQHLGRTNEGMQHIIKAQELEKKQRGAR